MKRPPLTLAKLASENRRAKPTRSFFLLFMVFFFSLAICLGSLFLHALSLGVERVSNRMGADVLVVPSGYKANMESVLLKGEPSSFYLPANAQDLLREQPGIARQTPQLFIATLSASCCSYPVQIIGFDPRTDFTILPWLRESLHRDLQVGEALVGANIVGEAGETIHFFNQEIKIAGHLEKTGMGFDGTVFVNMETAHQLAKASAKVGVKQAVDNSQTSVILLKVKPGLDPAKVAANLSKNLGKEGIFAMFSKAFVSDLSSKLSSLSTLILLGLALLWLLAIVVLSLSFSAMIHERKRELSALRILGASRRQLRRLVLLEAFQLSAMGALAGTLVALVLAILLFPALGRSFTIPLPTPAWTAYLRFALLALSLGMVIGPISSLPAAVKVSRREAYTSLREAD